eukprot:jgi/Ulvmu1/4171/UM019_0150.1
MGGQKTKKRVTYDNDGWQCDVCSNSQTSLRRNGPNNIRMCTACYSKMQREKKKGSTDGVYSERINCGDLVIDSHHYSVRGSRHASAAARKFIEEFARNKGGWDKADGSSRREIIHEQDAVTHQNSDRPIQEAAESVITANLASVPKRTSEELYHLAQSCCAVGNKILRHDGSFTPQTCLSNVTERSRHGHMEPGKLAACGPVQFTPPRTTSEHSYRREHQEPDVLQGAADLLHMMQEQSRNAGKTPPRQTGTSKAHHGAAARGTHLQQFQYSWSDRTSNTVCGNPYPVSTVPVDGGSMDYPFVSEITASHARGVRSHQSVDNRLGSRPYMDLRRTAYHCSSSDFA